MGNGLKTMDMAKNRAYLVQEVKRHMLRFLDSPPAAEIGAHCEALCGRFQALAICHFIENLDLVEFRINLRRSACAWRFFLERSREDGHPEDRFPALSRTEAFFDALVSGSRSLAMDIATASQAGWNREREREADFHYFRFLHLLIADPWASDAAQRDCLRRISESHEGGGHPRLSACRSLMDKDAEAFRESLDAMIAEKCGADHDRMRSVPPDDLLFWPRSLLYVEGLALMLLARLRGLGDAAFPKHPLCPRMALLPWTEAASEDIFRKIRIEAERQTQFG